MRPDEVNFWAPSGRTNFRSLQPGELFLFKLHAPHNFIVGGGVFSHGSNLPLSLAWDAFGAKNGAPDLVEMRRRVGRYRTDQVSAPYRSDPGHRMPHSDQPVLLAGRAMAAGARKLVAADRRW
jgi:putative restriction endonuclease